MQMYCRSDWGCQTTCRTFQHILLWMHITMWSWFGMCRREFFSSLFFGRTGNGLCSLETCCGLNRTGDSCFRGKLSYSKMCENHFSIVGWGAELNTRASSKTVTKHLKALGIVICPKMGPFAHSVSLSEATGISTNISILQERCNDLL